MLSKATPGPWKLDERESGILHVVGQGGTVATVSRKNGNGQPLPVEANAALICAAPDLLATSEAQAETIVRLDAEIVERCATWAHLSAQVQALTKEMEMVKHATGKIVAAKNAELAALSAEIDRVRSVSAATAAVGIDLVAENSRLRRLFSKYAKHGEDCHPWECSCGLDGIKLTLAEQEQRK